MQSTQERLEERYIPEPNSGCWLWTAAASSAGYGQLRVAGWVLYAHRLSYELFVGPIPEGMQIDHLCRVRSCVNPDHLEAVPQIENIRRWSRSITHCPRGHEYTEGNVRLQQGKYKICIVCKRESDKRYRQEKRALRLEGRC